MNTVKCVDASQLQYRNYSNAGVFVLQAFKHNRQIMQRYRTSTTIMLHSHVLFIKRFCFLHFVTVRLHVMQRTV